MRLTYWQYAKENLKILWMFSIILSVILLSMFLFWNLHKQDLISVAIILKVINLFALIGTYSNYKKGKKGGWL